MCECMKLRKQIDQHDTHIRYLWNEVKDLKKAGMKRDFKADARETVEEIEALLERLEELEGRAEEEGIVL